MKTPTTGPWTLSAGRSITTPGGTFYLTYGSDPKSGKPNYPDFCELDRIARAISHLPELCTALDALVATPTGYAELQYARDVLARVRGES
jgi:hypothetical protein